MPLLLGRNPRLSKIQNNIQLAFRSCGFSRKAHENGVKEFQNGILGTLNPALVLGAHVSTPRNTYSTHGARSLGFVPSNVTAERAYHGYAHRGGTGFDYEGFCGSDWSLKTLSYTRAVEFTSQISLGAGKFMSNQNISTNTDETNFFSIAGIEAENQGAFNLVGDSTPGQDFRIDGDFDFVMAAAVQGYDMTVTPGGDGPPGESMLCNGFGIRDLTDDSITQWVQAQYGDRIGSGNCFMTTGRAAGILAELDLALPVTGVGATVTSVATITNWDETGLNINLSTGSLTGTAKLYAFKFNTKMAIVNMAPLPIDVAGTVTEDVEVGFPPVAMMSFCQYTEANLYEDSWSTGVWAPNKCWAQQTQQRTGSGTVLQGSYAREAFMLASRRNNTVIVTGDVTGTFATGFHMSTTKVSSGVGHRVFRTFIAFGNRGKDVDNTVAGVNAFAAIDDGAYAPVINPLLLDQPAKTVLFFSSSMGNGDTTWNTWNAYEYLSNIDHAVLGVGAICANGMSSNSFRARDGQGTADIACSRTESLAFRSVDNNANAVGLELAGQLDTHPWNEQPNGRCVYVNYADEPANDTPMAALSLGGENMLASHLAIDLVLGAQSIPHGLAETPDLLFFFGSYLLTAEQAGYDRNSSISLGFAANTASGWKFGSVLQSARDGGGVDHPLATISKLQIFWAADGDVITNKTALVSTDGTNVNFNTSQLDAAARLTCVAIHTGKPLEVAYYDFLGAGSPEVEDVTPGFEPKALVGLSMPRYAIVGGGTADWENETVPDSTVTTWVTAGWGLADFPGNSQCNGGAAIQSRPAATNTAGFMDSKNFMSLRASVGDIPNNEYGMQANIEQIVGGFRMNKTCGLQAAESKHAVLMIG